MSENKEENSSASDVKEEEKSLKTEENKTVDDSSKDSDKDSAKEGSVKEESEKGSEKDESEEDEDDEEMGLLDRPVEVSGCRARKQVERLEVSFTTPKEKQFDIPAGKGDKLGDCPRIEYHIQKTLINELKPLHKILFTRVGSGPEVKKNIRKFSGFTFSKNSQEYDRKKAQIEKFTSTLLKRVCEVLDIERSGTKEDLVNRLLDFLLEPKDSGKAVPKKKQSAKEKKKSTEKKTSKKAKAKKDISSDEEPASANESVGKDSNDEIASDNEPQKKSKNASKAKKPSKSVAKKPEKKEKAKKEEKKPAKGSKRKREADSDDSEEEPSAKKNKMPTDDEIKKLVKRILDSADLQEITMKKVIKQVSDAYPDSDLSHKKAFIKSTIKSVIS